MLFEVFHMKEGKLVSFIDYRESSAYDLTREQIRQRITIVRPHRYVSKSPFYGVVRQGDKAFMIPEWVEVHPKTTYEDIKYVEKKERKPRGITKKWEFKSSSSDAIYKVKQMPDGRLDCDCWGFRAHKRCKHVKEVAEGRGA
jgi:hypothetical protein